MKKRIALFGMIVLLGLSTSLSAAVTYCAPSVFGYSTATGGGSATPVLVSSVSQLQSALNKGKNKVIIITKDLTFTSMLSVQDGSNVTLLGLPGVKLISLQQDKSTSGILFVKRFNNLIIRNLTFVGPGAYDCDGNDLLCFEKVTNAWVDHCDFQDGCDGNFDNKSLTDDVTVSWCRFRYLKKPKAGGSGGSDDHRFTNLLGSSDSDAPSDGKYNFTWAYCWWDEGCKERMVRCRNAELHFLNCYWNSSVANYYVGPYNTKAYFEGCTFEGKANTSKNIFKSYGGTNACKFVDCSGNLPSNSGSVSAPTYSYAASGRAEAKTAVTNATCGAGATLTVTTAGAVSSTCDGGAPLPTVYTVTWNATANGGSCGTASTQVTAGAAIGTLPEATKDEYNFDGWYTAPSGGDLISAATTVTGNVTYYAQFTSAPVTVYYTVIWDANGGTCATSSSEVLSGSEIGTLPTASKSGDYEFDAWYTAINGGTKITATTPVTGNVTYYAHYTATGGGGGGGDCEEWVGTPASLTGDEMTVGTNLKLSVGESASIDNAAVWSGSGNKVVFKIDGSAKYMQGHLIDNSDITTVTISAATNQSTAKLYAIVFSPNAAFSTDLTVYTHSAPSKDDARDDTKLVHEFSAPSGTKYFRVYRKFVYDEVTYGDNQTIRVYGVKACTGSSSTPSYTLEYDENGGSGTMVAETGTSVTVKACTFTAPTGYSFQKWNTAGNGGGADYAADAAITLTEDMTLYAIWQPNTYTVTLNAEGGSGGSASVTATFDAAMPDITVPTQSGYIFKGYYTGTNGTGTQYYDENGSSINSWMIASDTELHAYWEAGSVTPVAGCDLHFWFMASADATANGKSNDGTVFSGMVSDASDKSGSITIDGTSYSVTRRTGDHATFGSFTIPTGYTGTFYALAISSGGGDRQINLNNGSDVYELPVAGGSDSYKRIESEELPAGTYTIERDGTSNVRLGVVVVKLCTALPASDAPTISGQPTGDTYCAGDAIVPLSVTANNSGSGGTLSYQWKKDGVNIPSANSETYAPTETGMYACVVTNEETGKSPTSLSSDVVEVIINGAVAAPTMSQTENTVTITTATAGATIYYTTDGTNPATTSASGTSVTITADCTVKAFAEKDGCASSVTSYAATYVVSCPKWVGAPDSWTGSKITVGLLELETSDASKTAISSSAVWSGHNETVTTISGSNVYVQGHLTDGAELGTITISAANNQSTGDYNYVIIFCANSSFSSGVTGQTWAAPSASAAQDNAKLVHSFTAPVGAKYFRIYRKVDAIGGYAGGGDGKTTRIYRIEACPAETFEVTYKANGGTGADVVEDTRVVGDLPSTFIAPTGKLFDHWNTAPDNGGVSYDPGDAVTSDLTLYAQWVNYYTVTFDMQGHGSAIAPYSPVLYNATIDAPEDPVVVGWVFGGWYKEPECNNKWNFVSDRVTANTTLYAKWTSEPAYQCYIIGSCKIKDGTWKQGDNGSVGIYKYIPNGESSNIELSTDFTVEPATPSTGSFFYLSKDLVHLKDKDYWTTSSSSSRTIKAMDMKEATLQLHLGTLQAAKIELYGTTNTNSAGQIQLVASGKQTQTIETGSENNGKLYYTDLKQDAPYTGDEVSVVVGSQTERFVVIVYVPAVKITYDANGGTGTMAEQVASIGETVQLRENEFTLSGYKFLGWTTDPAGTGELITDGSMYIMGDVDVTLYAQWEEIVHTTITLDATGAYNSYTHSVVATNGEAMPEIGTLPLRVGYVFDGYYDEPNGAGTKYYTGLGAGVRNWDKTAATAILYAKWLTACNLIPTLTNVVPTVTIWDGQAVDMGIVKLTCDYDTTGVQYELLSISPTMPINGCHFEYFDEQIHLMGTPNVGNSSTQDVSVTFTMKNNCDPASTYTVTQQIRIYPVSQKPKIAFIITGKEGGDFDAYDTGDASSCHALVTYLSNYYDITYVNGYATKNESALASYYSNYDLLIVTDFLNTGKGYTNAIGTLIDKKPILSFEAYVANQSNWHIGSNPKDPKPKVKNMKVLCAGHAIFKNAKYNPSDAEETVVVRSDTTVNVLSSLSGAKDAKGLQGFTINEAPDFIFLATVRDANNNRDLIVCCERQVVFPARLLLYGINFYEMPNLSNAGQIIMKQMIDYLLMTDETKVADCSLVFDNGAGNPNPGGGNHLWNNPANWAPGYNIIPTPYHPTRIIAECWVNVDNAHAGSVKVNKGRDEHGNVVDGKLIVKPYGGLTIAGLVATVHDTRYASPITIKAEDLLIEADATGNGAFVYGNKESDVRATVQYYSRAEGANTANPIWQYIGIPFQVGQTAISMYYKAWMCRWAEGSTDALGGLWQWVNNEDVLVPFEGYCITQASPKTYTFSGKLNAPVTKTLTLDNRDADGYAFAANSWTAPMKIQEMEDADFVNAEKAIYLYHTGSYAQWGASGEPVNATTGAVSLPGQYAVIPIHSSPYLAGADSVIPAMQGFFVKTTPGEEAKLKLVYNRTIYDATYFKTSTQPMRSPRRANIDGPEVMRLTITGKSFGGDRVHLLSRSDFSDEYEDGWDGRKIAGDTAAPYLAVVKEAGEMAVASVAEYEGRNLSFRAGDDIEYTFSFHYEGDDIYLYDRENGQATLIRTGNTYSFSAVNKTPENRFLITANPPRTPTDLENTEYRIQNTEPKKFIYEDKLLIFYRGVIYDALGMPVKSGKEAAQ